MLPEIPKLKMYPGEHKCVGARLLWLQTKIMSMEDFHV